MAEERGKSEWVVEMEKFYEPNRRWNGMEPPLTTKEEEERKQWRRLYPIPASIRNKVEGGIYEPDRVRLGHRTFRDVRENDYNYYIYWQKEREKYTCAGHFVERTGRDSYLTALREVVDELEYAFFGLDQPVGVTRENFLHLMLVDGSFILEFIRTERDRKSGSPDAAASANPEIWKIVEDREQMKRCRRDILLVNNQFPILVLKTLLMVAAPGRITEDYWIGFLKDITATLMPTNCAPRREYMYKEFLDSLCILDVYRRSIIHRDFKGAKKPQRRKPQDEFYSTNIPSATELNKAGIGFTTSDSTSILDVSLRGKTLRLPVIVIDDSTRSLFLNLIAFEQLHKDVAKNEVASYMFFMGCLVQVTDDASLLQSRGIIDAKMPPAEVAKWFNQMTKSFSLDPDDLAQEFIEMFKMLRARYNKMSNEWRKDLFQNYLKSPWAIMSVFAGFVLLVLTTIQTVYTVLGYVRHK